MNVRRAGLLIVFLAGVCAVLTGALWQLERREAEPAQGAARVQVDPRQSRALAILRQWDERRARVWASGRVSELLGLYAFGSRTGANDRAMLKAYVDRGLVVQGMRTQVLSAELRAFTSRRIDLVVTDRLAKATAVGEDAEIPLPRDGASTRTVTLVRRHGVWVVTEAR